MSTEGQLLFLPKCQFLFSHTCQFLFSDTCVDSYCDINVSYRHASRFKHIPAVPGVQHVEFSGDDALTGRHLCWRTQRC